MGRVSTCIRVAALAAAALATSAPAALRAQEAGAGAGTEAAAEAGTGTEAEAGAGTGTEAGTEAGTGPEAGTAAAAAAAAPAVPEPKTGTLDWVRLVTGEWLPGEIDSLRDDDLKFDSEEFDDVVLDWGDVVEIYSPNPNRYVRSYHATFAGPAHIDRDTVEVQTPQGTVAFPRSELTAILPGALTEASRWSAHIGVSFDGNWGASRQTTFGTQDWLQREDARTRVRLDYNAAWGRASGTVNVNNMWGRGQFDLFISDLFFLTPVFGSVGYDRFLNFDLRATAGSGAGIHVVDESDFGWDVMAGLAYLYTRYISVQPAEPITAHDAAVVLGTTVDWDITDDIEFDATHQTLLVATDLAVTTYTTQAVLSMDLTDDIELDTTFRWTRIREPVTQADGTTPDNDQFQLLIGLGVDI